MLNYIIISLISFVLGTTVGTYIMYLGIIANLDKMGVEKAREVVDFLGIGDKK